VIYLFHGPDQFGLSEAVATLKRKLVASDPFAELNLSELDGRRLSVAELQTVADALPFMGDRRLVIVTGLVARCNPQGGDSGSRATLADGLKTYLPRMVPSTRLLLVDETVHGNNPMLKWADAYRAAQPVPDEAIVIRLFQAPPPQQLPRWLTARASARSGVIQPAAAQALADALDREGTVDMRLADNELEKLLVYAGDRPVTADDVEILVTPVSLDKVFALTDALADRNGAAAATLLTTFLENGEAPLRLMALIVRTFRQLTATRAHLDAGSSPTELASLLAVPPFVAKKLAQQSRRFSLPFLTGALKQLLKHETAIKTGRIDAVVALDLFVAGVCGGQHSPNPPSPNPHPQGGQGLRT
jgi:DNA polymerase-3 subunit delta